MTRPRSRFLTHAYPMWQACTFKELILLTTLVVVGFFLLAAFIALLVGHFPLVLLGLNLFLYPGVVCAARCLARYKKGKPPNFIGLRLAKRFNIGERARICQTGVWETRQTFMMDEG